MLQQLKAKTLKQGCMGYFMFLRQQVICCPSDNEHVVSNLLFTWPLKQYVIPRYGIITVNSLEHGS